MKPQALEVRDLVGVPFKWHGDDPSTGLDCWGLWKNVAKLAKLCLPSDGALRHGTGDDVAAGLEALSSHFQPIPVPPPKGWLVGDLIQQDAEQRGAADHLASVVDPVRQMALTTSERSGVILVRIGLLRNVVGALRVKRPSW